MAEQFCDVGGGITLCFERFGEHSDPAVLLIMGLGTQMVAWPDDFCAQLAQRGLHVVRFDNRDVGRSTHIAGPVPTLAQLVRRSRSAARYTLTDMAQDASGLLRELDLAPAHVIGASMGGMIAQTFAAQHPEQVSSLVSIMSSTGNRFTGQPALRIYPLFLRRPPAERDAYISHYVRMFDAIGSRVEREPGDIRAIAAASYDRDRDPRGMPRQLAAIIASGDRTAELRRISAPTLVIHGTSDPLVAASGGRATARAIPRAQLMLVPNMGHDLPRVLWPQLLDAIGEHIVRAGGAPQRHPPLPTRPTSLSAG